MNVYMDYGSGYIDITQYVRDDLSLTLRYASDDYKHAEKVANFTLNYDPDIYASIRGSESGIWVKVTGFDTSNPSSFFEGIVPPTLSRQYNGIMGITQFQFEAVSPFELLDVEVGDVVYYNNYVMNPADTANSIVHKLLGIAGIDAGDIGTASITTQYPVWSPPSETDHILEILDNFLYENGYVLEYVDGKFTATKWIDTPVVSSLPIFDQDNIIESVQISENDIDSEGTRVTYTLLGEKKNVLLYKEDLPFDDDGGFSGYPVISGSFYPVECNVIDDSTGNNQIVYQEYTDNSIKYLTNKAIVNGLDYNWRAFKSDFSAIVATSNHVLEYSFETASGYTLDIVTSDFNNKKAQVLLKNNAEFSLNLYYLNIRGDVAYRTAERKCECITVSGTKKIDDYVSTYIYDATQAETLAKARADIQLNYGNTLYKFKSLQSVREGSLVAIWIYEGTDLVYRGAISYSGTETFDGDRAFGETYRIGMITERRYDAYTDMYEYEIKAYSPDYGANTINKRIIKAETLPAALPTVDFRLSPYSVAIPTDKDGTNPVYTNAYCDLSVLTGGISDINKWTLSADGDLDGSFGTGALASRFYITSVTNDNSYVDLTISRSGYPSYRQRLAVFKQKAVPTVPSDIGATSPETVPKYLGGYLLPTPGLPSTGVNEYDTALGYSLTTADCGIYEYTTVWNKVSTPTTKMISDAWPDVCNVVNSGYGNVTDYTGGGVNFINALAANVAFINSLFANQVVITSGGHMRSSSVTSSGVMPDDGKAFYIGSDGTTKFSNVETQGLVATTVSGTTYEIVRSDKASGFNNPSYALWDAFRIAAKGSATVVFTFYNTGATGTAYVAIYRNGTPYSLDEYTSSTTTPVVITKNIEVSSGDIIALYVKTSATTVWGYLYNFHISSSSKPGVISYLSPEKPIAAPASTVEFSLSSGTFSIPYGKYLVSIHKTSGTGAAYLQFEQEYLSGTYVTIASTGGSFDPDYICTMVEATYTTQYRINPNGQTITVRLITVL